MLVHSKDGSQFLGFRKSPLGRFQMVYDWDSLKREVYDVETPNVSKVVLEKAMKNAIDARHVMPALIDSLTAQNIVLRQKY